MGPEQLRRKIINEKDINYELNTMNTLFCALRKFYDYQFRFSNAVFRYRVQLILRNNLTQA